jgi:hypothetical protein
VDDPGQSCSGGIATGEKDGDKLVPDLDWVMSMEGEGAEESVVSVRAVEFFEFVNGKCKSFGDELGDEVVDSANAVVVRFLGDEWKEWST